MNTAHPLLFDKLSISTPSNHWRDALFRDIECLLNNAARSGQLFLHNYTYCQHSVLNYGLPSLSQQLPINADALTLAQHIKTIITVFEPRIDPRSMRVVPVMEKSYARLLAVLFDINGICTIPDHQAPFNLRIALDYSCGAVTMI